MINPNLIETFISDADSIPRNHRIHIAFILWWTLFEAFIKDQTGEFNNTRRALDEIKKNPGYVRQGWDKISITNLVGSINVVKKYCPVYDKRTSPPNNPLDITDPVNPDLAELIEILYRLRCNLIHGQEDPRSNSNVELYTACRDILAPWVKQLA